jgi:hypothetical protein
MKTKSPPPTDALRAIAMSLPDVEEGVACKGTPIEKRTFKAKKKAFLFLGVRDAMVKLSDSVAGATKLAAKHPTRYKVGSNGWTTAMFGEGMDAPLDLLERWIDESYRVVTSSKSKSKSKSKPAAKNKKTATTTTKKKKKKKTTAKKKRAGR